MKTTDDVCSYMEGYIDGMVMKRLEDFESRIAKLEKQPNEKSEEVVTLNTIHKDIETTSIKSSEKSNAMIIIAISSLIVGFASLTISVVNSVISFGFNTFSWCLIIADSICFISVVTLMTMMIVQKSTSH